jgi:predicted DNA-binding protein (UPF0251 family)/predicted Fe-Mo cluster-binding NifX family protein
MPGVTYFKPAGVPLRLLKENRLSLDEIEAIRLRDIEQLEQVECATKMGVSRPTFQRILSGARNKITDSIINGKALKIEGGNFEFINDNTQKRIENVEVNNVKIAVVTEDEKTISQHFGRANWYKVFIIEDGKIAGTEKRAKVGHQQFAGQDNQHGPQSGAHGFGAGSQQRHAGMAAAISDCQVIIAGGMGMGAYESLKIFNIEPLITDKLNIDDAINAYLAGNLPNLMERLH